MTGSETAVKVEVDDRSGLAETTANLGALMNRHPSELAQISSVLVKVDLDFDRWWEEHRDADERPKRPPDYVRIRISKYGTTLTVGGRDRNQVEGLTRRLGEALGHGATDSPGFDRGWIPPLVIPLILVSLWLSLLVVQGLGLAEENDRLEPAEVSGLVVAAVLPAALAAGVWWLLPPVEMLDESGVPRARRFRKWVIGVVGALVLALIGALISNQLK